jgi:hypothetical protein
MERKARLGTTGDLATTTVNPDNVVTIDPSKVESPEAYFGASRNEYLANGAQNDTGEQTLTIPDSVELNKLYLGGTWNFMLENAQSSAGSKAVFKYSAKNVYLVAGSSENANVDVYKDGTFVKNIKIEGEQLYPLIDGNDYGEHTLELRFNGKVKAFTFTFG